MMVVPAFGFSVGDVVSAIQLITKVAKALKETGGASQDFQLLLQELQQLEIILEQLQHVPGTTSAIPSHLNAVKAVALAVQVPLKEFLAKIEKFGRALSSENVWKKAGRKVEWAITMQEETSKIRAILTMKIVSLSLLVALPNG
jgi:hypothetical protein